MLKPGFLAAMAVSILLVFASGPADAGNPCNPCNPCAKKANPCNPCNPCANKPTPIRSKHITNYKKLVAMGKKLWNDDTLGKSGSACMTCHEDYDLLNLDRHNGQWPHDVPGMTNDIYTLDQMVNFCMMNPMEAKPLDPTSIKMTAMAAYYREYIKSYKPGNPCAGKKMRNPCNPCGGKKRMNPCNPCAGKR